MTLQPRYLWCFVLVAACGRPEVGVPTSNSPPIKRSPSAAAAAPSVTIVTASDATKQAVSPAPEQGAALAGASTTLTLNAGHDIILDANTAGQTYTVTNTGAADWDATVAGALALDVGLDGITANFTDCTSSVLPAGSSCSITFSASAAAVGYAATLSAGSNGTATSISVQTVASLLDVQGVVLTQPSSSQQQYLMLNNFSTTSSITINSAAFNHTGNLQDVSITLAADIVLAPGGALSIAVEAGNNVSGSDTFTITYTPAGEPQSTVTVSVLFDPNAV